MAVQAPRRSRTFYYVPAGFGVAATVAAAAAPFGALIVGLIMAFVFRRDPRLKSMFALLGGGLTILITAWMLLAPSGIITHIGPSGTITATTQR